MKQMFGQGKIYPKQPQKAKRQHGGAYYVIGAFTYAIEAMLGINAAFLVRESLIIVLSNMLTGTALEPLGAMTSLIISLGFGVALAGGGIWTFSGFMDALDDARAYRDMYHPGKKWPVAMVWLLAIAIIAIDCTTLLFRASFFAEKGAIALLAFFVVLIFLPPILGALMHVLENTPRERRLTKARQYGEQLEAGDAFQVVEEMDPDLRSVYLGDDQQAAAAALQEHYERVNQRRQEAWEYEQQQMRDRQVVNRPLVTIPVPKMFQPKKQLTALPSQAQQSGQDQSRRA